MDPTQQADTESSMSIDSIISLSTFQQHYLHKLLDNVTDRDLYKGQSDGYNSAGWLVGHLCVEAEDVLEYLDFEQTDRDPAWPGFFRNTTGRIRDGDALPGKDELLQRFDVLYPALCRVYREMADDKRRRGHPSQIIRDRLPNLDAWVAHHLTTHLSVHCGNLATWKKTVGIEVDGY